LAGQIPLAGLESLGPLVHCTKAEPATTLGKRSETIETVGNELFAGNLFKRHEVIA